MRRDLGAALFFYTILGAAVCSPVPEFESRLSPDKVGKKFVHLNFNLRSEDSQINDYENYRLLEGEVVKVLNDPSASNFRKTFLR
jgi:uncharacterized protein YehS (DUF1456 family)